MNDARRVRLQEARSLLERVRAIVDTVFQEEQRSFDNIPERMQSGRSRPVRQNQLAYEALSDIHDSLEQADSKLIEAINTRGR
jgi:hypothetical protein